MGLFDGASGRGELASTGHVAKLLQAPVLLVIDAASMARSVAAVVHGYRSYDPAIDIAGVVLNKVGSDVHEELLREAIEPLGVPVVGALRRDERVGRARAPPRARPGGRARGRHASGDRGARRGGRRARRPRRRARAGARGARRAGPAWSPGRPTGRWRGRRPPRPARPVRPGRPTGRWRGRRPPRPARSGRRPTRRPARPPRRGRDRARPGVLVPLRGEPRAAARGRGRARRVRPDGRRARCPRAPARSCSPAASPRSSARSCRPTRRCASASPRSRAAGGRSWPSAAGCCTSARSSTAGRCAACCPRRRGWPGACRSATARRPRSRSRPAGPAAEAVRGHEFHYSLAEPRDGGDAAAWTLAARGRAWPEGFVAGGVHASFLHVHWAAFPQAARRLVAAAARSGDRAPAGTWA